MWSVYSLIRQDLFFPPFYVISFSSQPHPCFAFGLNEVLFISVRDKSHIEIYESMRREYGISHLLLIFGHMRWNNQNISKYCDNKLHNYSLKEYCKLFRLSLIHKMRRWSAKRGGMKNIVHREKILVYAIDKWKARKTIHFGASVLACMFLFSFLFFIF